MNKHRETLVPSSDLAEYYSKKISYHLTNASLYRDELETNNKLVLKINFELSEVFKMIKERLKRFELNECIDEYNKINENIKKVVPFTSTFVRNDSGDRVRKLAKTKQYKVYDSLIQLKECCIYDSLDKLGYFGKVKYETRKLR